MQGCTSEGAAVSETFAGGIPPEVAPVRAGEELDWGRLAAYLGEETPGGEGAST